MTQYERNRKVVQQGLDRRAAQRKEAAQDAADRRVYEEINRQGRENRVAIERTQEIQRRRAAQAQALADVEAQAVKRFYACVLGTFIPLMIAAIFTILYTTGGVKIWVAIPAVALAVVFTIVNFVACLTGGHRTK